MANGTIKSDCGLLYGIYTDMNFFGSQNAIGTINVIINGGKSQPNCSIWRPICDHFRSIFYFIESLRTPNKFTMTSNSGNSIEMFRVYQNISEGDYEMYTSGCYPYHIELNSSEEN